MNRTKNRNLSTILRNRYDRNRLVLERVDLSLIDRSSMNSCGGMEETWPANPPNIK